MKRLYLIITFLAICLPPYLYSQGYTLPPVFGEEMDPAQYQSDHRARVYLSPEKVGTAGNVENELNLRWLADYGQATTAAVPYTTMRSEEGNRARILMDFGREIQGGLQIVTGMTEGGGPVKVRIRFGESISEAQSNTDTVKGATNDHAMRDYTVELPWLGVLEVGNTGFRFVNIDLLDEGVTLPLKEVRAIFTYRDIPYLGSFRSSDPRLDSIWMTGAYTVHLNMQEYLWDGIKRDRLVWLGDMHPELRTINAVFGDNEVISRSLDLARDQTPLPGWMNDMCSYSLWWVLIHHDYYMWGGDRRYLAEQEEYLTELLGILNGYVDDKGNEHLDGGGRFLDWPTSENRAAIDAGLHALLLMALDKGAYLCEQLGNEPVAEECRASVKRMRQVMPDYTASKQSAALTAMAGLVKPEKADEEVISIGGVKDFSTFYGYYMLEAKAMAGNYAEAMDNISRYWGGMLDLGATTFWEDFNIDWLENANRIDHFPEEGKVDVHAAYGGYCYKGLRHSLCHGWASGPTAWLSEHVLGVGIASPGCREVTVQPNLGNLEWAEGTFPTPYGVIKVRHDRQKDGSVHSKIDTPKGVKVIMK